MVCPFKIVSPSIQLPSSFLKPQLCPSICTSPRSHVSPRELIPHLSSGLGLIGPRMIPPHLRLEKEKLCDKLRGTVWSDTAGKGSWFPRESLLEGSSPLSSCECCHIWIWDLVLQPFYSQSEVEDNDEDHGTEKQGETGDLVMAFRNESISPEACPLSCRASLFKEY